MKLIVDRYKLSIDNSPEERAIGIDLFFRDNSWKRFINDHMKILLLVVLVSHSILLFYLILNNRGDL